MAALRVYSGMGNFRPFIGFPPASTAVLLWCRPNAADAARREATHEHLQPWLVISITCSPKLI
jgi:hypothetical protein